MKSFKTFSITLLFCSLFSSSSFAQISAPLKVTIIDSSSKELLDSVTVTFVKYRRGRVSNKRVVIVNKTTATESGWGIFTVEKKGYESMTQMRDSYYKKIDYGKSIGYVIEIPLKKIKSGVKLVPK